MPTRPACDCRRQPRCRRRFRRFNPGPGRGLVWVLAGLLGIAAASARDRPVEPDFYHGPQESGHPNLLTIAVGDDQSMVVELRYPNDQGGFQTAIGTGRLDETTREALVNDLVAGGAEAVRLRWRPDHGQVTLEWVGAAPARDFRIDGSYQRLTREQRLGIARNTYAKADQTLLETEAALAAAAVASGDRAAAEALTSDQQSWREALPDSVELAWNGFEGDDPVHQLDPNYWDLLTDLLQARGQFIRLRADDRPLASITGSWWDGAHGQLMITDSGPEATGEAGFDFEIHTLRGRGAHVGHVSGRAAMIDDTTALWRDSEPAAFIDGQPAELTFRFDGRRVVISGQRTQYYHGAAAHFDGDYHHLGRADGPAEKGGTGVGNADPG